VLIPMVIAAIVTHSSTETPVVILKEVDGEEMLPVWIGLPEAEAIVSELKGMRFSRPMTHDLLKNILELIHVKVVRVEICDLKSNTYFALIRLRYGEKEISIDARPSDAMALSARMNAPIFVADAVIRKSRQTELQDYNDGESEQTKKWKEILENMNPDDFGNT